MFFVDLYILLFFLGVEGENSVWLRVVVQEVPKDIDPFIFEATRSHQLKRTIKMNLCQFFGPPPKKKYVNSFGSGGSEQFGTVRS